MRTVATSAVLNDGERLVGPPSLVQHGHERAGDGDRVAVLNDVASVDDAGRTLRDDGFRASQEVGVTDSAPAAHQHRDARRSFDLLSVSETVVRIGCLA